MRETPLPSLTPSFSVLSPPSISEGKDFCLWHWYKTNSYKQVKGEQRQRKWHTVQRSVESVREDLWDRKARLYAGLQCTPVHMFLLCTFYLLFNCLSHAQQLLSSLLPPPSQQMTTCFRSQGLTPVSWWFWKWRMQMKCGPERPTLISVNGELPFYKYLALPLSTAVWLIRILSCSVL